MRTICFRHFILVFLIPALAACGRTGVSEDLKRFFGAESADPLAPAIILNGDNPYFIEWGVGDYSEPGAQAISIFENNLTPLVETTAAIDTANLGTYEVVYTVTDPDTGRTGRAIREVVVRDTIKPEVTILSPSENTRTAGPIAISGRCESGINVLVSGEIKETVAVECEEGSYLTQVTLEGETGSRQVQVTQVDLGGNVSDPARSNYFLDTNAASVTLVAQNNFVNLANQADFSLQGTCSEQGRAVNLSVNGSFVADAACNGESAFQFTLDLSSFSDGPLEIQATHADEFNQTGSVTISVTKDTVPPRIEQIAFAPEESPSNELVERVFTFAGAEVVNYKAYLEDGALSANNLNCRANPLNQAPSRPIDETIRFTPSDQDRSYVMCAIGQDEAGNFQSTSVATKSPLLKIDRTAPVVDIDNPPAGTITSGALTLAGTCESGLAVRVRGDIKQDQNPLCRGGNYQMTIELAGSGNGIDRTVRVSQIDQAGNTSDVYSRSFVLDTEVPSLTAETESNFINKENENRFNISGTCSESDEDVEFYRGASRIDDTDCKNNETFSEDLDFRSFPEGEVQITVRHEDKAGLEAPEVVLSLTKDTQAPTITINDADLDDSPTNDARTRSVSFSGSDVVTYQVVARNSNSCQSVSPSGSERSMNQDFSFEPQEGNNIICAFGRDEAGNQQANATASKVLRLDTQPPAGNLSFVLDSPSDPSGTYRIEISGNDVSHYRAAVSQSASCSGVDLSTMGEQPISNPFLFDPTQDGEFYICAIGRDSVSNYQTTASVSNRIVVDRTPPEVTLSTPMSGFRVSRITEDSFEVRGTCSENTQPVAIKINSRNETANCSSNQFQLESSLSSLDLEIGDQISVQAAQTDTAGNEGQSATIDGIYAAVEVCSSDDLNFLRDFPQESFELCADGIDLSSVENFEPIQNFEGVFDGKNKVISGLTIDRPNQDRVGLFGELKDRALIKNLEVKDATIRGDDRVGVLAGDARGTLRNIRITGNSMVTAREGAGGLAGYVQKDTLIKNSMSRASIVGVDTGGETSEEFGGLVGQLQPEASIENSSASGSVSAPNSRYVGGFVGKLRGQVSDSYARGDVLGSEQVGGFVGRAEKDSEITRAYSSGVVDGEEDIGGFAGFVENLEPLIGAFIEDSFWNTESSNQTESDGGTGLNEMQMKQADSFTSFDFMTVWEIDEGNSYPTLR